MTTSCGGWSHGCGDEGDGGGVAAANCSKMAAGVTSNRAMAHACHMDLAHASDRTWHTLVIWMDMYQPNTVLASTVISSGINGYHANLHRTHDAAGAPPPTRGQGLLPCVLAATASMVITPDALLMAAAALAQGALPVNDEDLNTMN